MSIQSYWPSFDNVQDCILSEAERLSDKLLIAVHHPTKLIATGYGTNTPEVKSQQELLDHLLNSNHIIPLLGESGSGKSHLIRWLDAIADTHPKAIEENWHVIRIPKNASLSQVLEIMLYGLKGDVFDQARKHTREVSNGLSEETTRGLLFTHLNEALRAIPEALTKKGESLKVDGNLTPEKRVELREEMTFAKQLTDFFADPYIQTKFSGDRSVINNRISRLIEIKSYAELLDEHFELTGQDFLFTSGEEMSFNLGRQAKTAYRNLQLASDESKRKMAAEITNKAIDRACKLMFNRLFQFSTGNFQDLFKEIRKYLLAENKTLVVLVEDLAAISAIDDVLIDSLLEQDMDDGEQVLCPMKSVIAATDGLESYQSHRSSIWTRGGYEWRLPSDNDVRQFPELAFSNEDVLNFCARYINAARHGVSEVKRLVDVSNISLGLPIWENTLDESELKILEEFGSSPNNIPLFPYNKQAIMKLTQKHVFSAGHTRFNPRVAIQQVLLAILRDHNGIFLQGGYPSAWFEGQLNEFRHDETAQFIQQRITDKEMSKRLVGFMSLYSDGRSTEENLKQVSAGQASAFNLDTSFLSDDVTLASMGQIIIGDPIPAAPTPTVKPTKPKSQPVVDELKIKVDEWFAGSAQLDQGLSNQLRQGLFQMLENHKGFSDYSVDKTKNWGPSQNLSMLESVLKEGSKINIGVPGSATNLSNKKYVNAFAEEVLSDSLDSMSLKRQMLAVLRYTNNNSTNKTEGWSYPKGFEDYIHYQDFAQTWVQSAMQTCVKIAKHTALDPLGQQVALAKNLGVDLSSPAKRLNQLVQTSAHIKSRLPEPINELHSEVLNKWLDEWDKLRDKWLRTIVVGKNNAIHPVDFKNAYKQINDLVGSNSELMPVIRDVSTQGQMFFDYLVGSETKMELKELLESLNEVYKKIPAEMIPNYSDTMTTVRKRTRDLAKIVTSETPKSVMGLMDNSKDPLQLLNKINGKELRLWQKVLKDWISISPKIVKDIRKFNQDNGANKIEQYTGAINDRLTLLDSSLEVLGDHNES
ncbi:hypothetical protein CXF72_17010 [Psychromonas sp. MB-3u-54]|uniref:protein DpdH n=1 Tax=Psychromonas sp. MB-3u-54 TaxID=2058319 RepID=UPI000C34DF3D|nr:protein DpdH [Psychromonas sp. MB-3u-54]PKH01372.1 hypothetical protein CXF72_17010 [Psychromonas sp. MB-3u-54]